MYGDCSHCHVGRYIEVGRRSVSLIYFIECHTHKCHSVEIHPAVLAVLAGLVYETVLCRSRLSEVHGFEHSMKLNLRRTVYVVEHHLAGSRIIIGLLGRALLDGELHVRWDGEGESLEHRHRTLEVGAYIHIDCDVGRCLCLLDLLDVAGSVARVMEFHGLAFSRDLGNLADAMLATSSNGSHCRQCHGHLEVVVYCRLLHHHLVNLRVGRVGIVAVLVEHVVAVFGYRHEVAVVQVKHVVEHDVLGVAYGQLQSITSHANCGIDI